MPHSSITPHDDDHCGRPQRRQQISRRLTEVASQSDIYRWLPHQTAILLWAMDKSRRSSCSLTKDSQPAQPRATPALSRALWSEFPELRGCRDSGAILKKMFRMVHTMLDKNFILPACDLPDIDARIDRVVVEACRAAMCPQGSEGMPASNGSAGRPTYDDSDEEQTEITVGCCWGI